MFIENGEQGQRQIMLWDNFAADQWKPAVTGLWKTTCDLANSGFTAKEWAAAKHNLEAGLKQRTINMPKTANVDLAKDLSHVLADGRDLIPPDELLSYARMMLPQISARNASNWWREQWGSGVEHLRVEDPDLAKVKNPVSAIRAAAVEAVGTSTCKLS
jgi:hypothetical protein